MNDRLDLYSRKRRFDETPEPSGTAVRKKTGRRSAARVSNEALSYVIQEHDARRLHYDFRLELNGTLLSWAVPKGPSLDPSVKRLAVHVEDHPVEYGSFEGEIPPGNYGAGTVIVWDRGTWEPVGGAVEAARSYKAGKLKFRLSGEKLHGGWTLVRSHMRGSGDKEQWLLIKERDDEARDQNDYDVLKACPGSVLEGSESVGKRAKATRTATKTAASESTRQSTGRTAAKTATKAARTASAAKVKEAASRSNTAGRNGAKTSSSSRA
ncbi:MAG TPA: DNA polymerase ligase N-terminal domain-containing protein, partial [Paraburkholderia sp.]